MIFIKDHKTLNTFDQLDKFGSKQRKLIEDSWGPLFRNQIFHNFPVNKIGSYFCETTGTLSKELYLTLGLVLLQKTFDLTDKQTVYEFVKWTQDLITVNLNYGLHNNGGL